ncbi:MAG: zinc ribbon domain-containing protein [Deltaproteobacteria bacterium]|nr:zinc ribbon domain-containing protein [Deltaproteobacteria bacterium]
MPIYEFYCSNCHMIFNFFSKRVNTKKAPICPRCDTCKLTRKMSVFATVSGGGDEGGDDDMPVDPSKMEKAVEMLANESEHINPDDPRQAATLMRKLSGMTGMELGSGMEEAIRRMEKGEDPEQIEADLGGRLENEEPFFANGRRGKRAGRKNSPPGHDDTLYDL